MPVPYNSMRAHERAIRSSKATANRTNFGVEVELVLRIATSQRNSAT